MTLILTLIAPQWLDAERLAALCQKLVDRGAKITHQSWLAPHRVVDLAVEGLEAEDLESLARAHFRNQPLDLLAQNPDGRRKKLLIADMDSTMVLGETLDDLARFAGKQTEITAITARAMRGEIDFKAALRERVGMLSGLSVTALAATDETIRLMPGARTLVATMRAEGAYAVLVSGGFDFFTSRVRDRCGFDEDRANRLEIIDGALTGRVIEPILDRDAKLSYLQEFAAKKGVGLDSTLAVGDGANDLAMILAAGLGVAYQAKPVVAAQAKFRVDHNDLTALLFAQGYREEEFRGSTPLSWSREGEGPRCKLGG